MTTNLRPYPEYKDSGLSWLGRIPAHWDEKRAKYYFNEVDERSVTGQEQLMSVSHVTGVTPRKQNVTMFMAESNVGHKICRPDDFVINTMWAWMAAMGVARQSGLVSPSYGVYRPRNNSAYLPDYVDHLLRTQPYASEYLCRSTGIRASRLRLYPDDFLDIRIVHPPREEQESIVRFIAHHDRLVRRFIRNRRRLIKALNEQQQAVIERAVTRGLNPDVPVKSSGIDWLGDMPEHWEIRRLRHLARMRLSSVDKIVIESELSVRLCNYVDVYHNDRITRDIDFMPGSASEAEAQVFELRGGDVLITKDSEDWEDIAVPAFVPEAIEGVVCGYHLAVIRPREDAIYGEYLAWAFSAESVAIQFRVAANGVTRYGLPQEAIKGAFFPVPPIDEQCQIVAAITGKCNRIVRAVEKAKREIDLIREFRTRLIADVVTGKLDVREAGSALGKEPAETEDVDKCIDDMEMLGDCESELVEEAADAND